MLLGVIADDFTGASDIANTIAKSGLATTQFLEVPDQSYCEAGVIALKSRSIPADEAVRQSLAALRWLQEQGCRQFIFKVCSTFDSTPAGNIGPVAEALAKTLGVYGVPVCPSFPTAGRTVYQGHLFVGDRLLNQSGLENHPLNPMTDPDIRRLLRKQATEEVGLVDWQIVSQGAIAIRSALKSAEENKTRLVIVDAITDQDLVHIGQACESTKLLCGGSGIALGLPENFRRMGLASGTAKVFKGKGGAEAILAGSCSATTMKQIAHHKLSHPTLPIDVNAIMDGSVKPQQLVDFIRTNEGGSPLAYSSSSPVVVAEMQKKYGRERVAQKLDSFFAESARELVKAGIRRLVVAGGETSGAVVGALKLKSLAIGPEIDPGVPALSADGSDLLLALKSGNFGTENFFEKALSILGNVDEH